VPDEAVGAHDLDHRPAARKRGGDLRDTRVAAARGRVDRLEQADLGLERHRVERARVSVEVAVAVAGRRRWPGFGRIEQRQRRGGAADRRSADLISVSEAGHLARHSAQAEPGVAAVVGGFEPAVVEAEALGGDELHVKLAVVAVGERVASQHQCLVGREAVGAVDQAARVRGFHRPDIARRSGDASGPLSPASAARGKAR
jgi:hypothetical protein